MAGIVELSELDAAFHAVDGGGGGADGGVDGGDGGDGDGAGIVEREKVFHSVVFTAFCVHATNVPQRLPAARQAAAGRQTVTSD